VTLRRVLVLAAVLLLLTTVAAGLSPRDPADDPAAASAGSSLPVGETVEKRIPSAAGANTTVKVRRGDLLRLEVAGDNLDSVLLERLDQMDAIEPSTPARFELLIEQAPGTYPIRLVEADRRIGRIEISERR
jgi:hypothetical protein